jgi:hypothetical protein
MRPSVCRSIAAVAVALVSVACARAAPTPAMDSGAETSAASIPSEFSLTCQADGSSSVSDSVVQAQPDGVHLRVVNEYDEPVSVGGFDADPGTTHWTLAEAPGRFDLSCWPFSQHGSGEEPPNTAVEVVDPLGLFVPGELDCPGESMSGVPDYAEAPVENGPPPLDVARESIPGLLPSDIVKIAGYPDQENAPVIVIRNDTVIASYGFARFEGQPWSIAGGNVCADMGLHLLG